MSKPITINATHLDALDRIEYFIEYMAAIPGLKKTIEYELEDCSTKDIKDILNSNEIDNCRFENNSLFVTRPLSAEEIAAEIADYQDRINYWIERIIKWSENEEYRVQINNYLDKHNIKYMQVIKRLKAV